MSTHRSRAWTTITANLDPRPGVWQVFSQRLKACSGEPPIFTVRKKLLHSFWGFCRAAIRVGVSDWLLPSERRKELLRNAASREKSFGLTVHCCCCPGKAVLIEQCVLPLCRAKRIKSVTGASKMGLWGLLPHLLRNGLCVALLLYWHDWNSRGAWVWLVCLSHWSSSFHANIISICKQIFPHSF